MSLPKIIFIVGPTASGKSEVALQLAEKYNGAIFNCDSIQVFKELNIGAAKPSVQDFKRAPHFLYDFLEYPAIYTAGDYCRDFYKKLSEVENTYQFIFVVGGTGFYFQALEKGMFEAGKADPQILEKLKQELESAGGGDRLYQELQEKDPESASWIHKNDHYRIQRALGVLRTEGLTMSALKKNQMQNGGTAHGLKNRGYTILKYGLQVDKIVLEKQIERRVNLMIASGFQDEVDQLLKKGCRNWAPLQSVGYREMIDFIDHKIDSIELLKEKIVIATRQLAKKQRTWFQRDLEINWLSPQKAFEEIEKKMGISND